MMTDLESHNLLVLAQRLDNDTDVDEYIDSVDKLILLAKKEIIKDILDWCYKNNTVSVGKYNIATTDGGHVNVLKLQEFLEGKA